VGLFGGGRRTRLDDGPMDEALAVLTVTQAARLRSLMRDSLARNGLEVTVHADHMVDDADREFGLDSLARSLAGGAVPARRWRAEVETHVRRLLAVADGPDEFDAPAEQLLANTYLRLYDRAVTPVDADTGREVVTGVVELLALDLPDAVAVYPAEEVDRLGEVALRAAGWRNLRRVQADERVEIDGVQVLMGESMHLASTVLLLPEVVLRTTGEADLSNGVLVAMPFRHQLLYHVPRDGRVTSALQTITRLAVSGYSDGVGPLCPHVFWWRGGEFLQLTEHNEDGTVALYLEGEFADLVARLTGDGGTEPNGY